MASDSAVFKVGNGSLEYSERMHLAGAAMSDRDYKGRQVEGRPDKRIMSYSDSWPTKGNSEQRLKRNESNDNHHLTSGLKDEVQGHVVYKERNGGQDGDHEAAESSYSYQEGEDLPLLPGRSPLGRGKSCVRTNVYIYLSHFLSAWGDNMWTFAVGVFLVEMDGDSLQLTASFGLTMGVCTLLLGPIIGDWVDTMPRLRAAQEALLLQNVMIALCAGFIYNMLEFEPEIEGWGEWAPIAHYILIILLGTGAFLAHIANIIAIERDWVVEICGQDDDKLASMSAAMRAIDLIAMIVAPIATGQVMTFFSSKVGALAIAAWNVGSFFLEYLLLWKVYSTVPALQKDKNLAGAQEKSNVPKSQVDAVDSLGRSQSEPGSIGSPSVIKTDVETDIDGKQEKTFGPGHIPVQQSRKQSSCKKRLERLFSGVTIIAAGWKTYVKYQVALSGVSLALLYMTVLGFDNVTIGYAKMQCLSEFEVGLMMGAAGLVGAMGTLLYPIFRRCLGLPWTGMLALTLQSATLSMCVVSVWLPGSPFDLNNPDSPGLVCEANTTTTKLNQTVLTSSLSQKSTPETGPTLTSVIVLMAGIIAARFGLWIADLAITQMFLETVVESERGIVNGVQQSLNQFLELVKFVLVIILPKATQFGLLVILSFSFVASGWLLYVVFLVRIPKHLFQKKLSVGG